MDYPERIRKIRQELSRSSAETLVLIAGPNLRYLGLGPEENSQVVLFVGEKGDPVLAAHEVYEDRLEPGFGCGTVFSSGLEDAVEEAAEHFPGKALLDDRMWEQHSIKVRDALDSPSYGLASEIMDRVRAVKNSDEVEAVREASTITDRVVEKVRGLGDEAVEMTERELACRIESWIEEEGGEGTAFDTIVAAGPGSAEPHHEPSNREIGEGEPVVLDFGAKKKGYASDQTRTLVFSGEPSEKFREVFEAVRDAQQIGVEAVGPGADAEQVHEKVTARIEESGHGDCFLHGTGHGVGVDVHESPGLGEDSDTELEPGMLVTVEPGVYIEGEFGVRIEDLLLVTEDGSERLNQTPRGWKL